jgi:hypothetical protein
VRHRLAVILGLALCAVVAGKTLRGSGAAGGPGPASLRNLAITILRLTGHTSIAALRHHARRPSRPLQTIMNC